MRRCFRSARRAAAALCVLVAMGSFAWAQGTLTGTVTNGTTGKPAANAEVILLSLTQGMQETAKTHTDAAGKFSLNMPDAGPHLVRVAYANVNYNRMAPPGVSTVDMK